MIKVVITIIIMK